MQLRTCLQRIRPRTMVVSSSLSRSLTKTVHRWSHNEIFGTDFKYLSTTRYFSSVGTSGVHNDPALEKKTLESLRQEHLFKLVEAGNVTEIEKIMESVPIGIDTTDESGKTMLMLAAEKNHLDIVQYLLDRGANVHHQDKYGDTPLSYASKANSNESREAICQAASNQKTHNNDPSTNISS